MDYPNYDYNKENSFTAFITNPSKYNKGTFVGEWVNFYTTA